MLLVTEGNRLERLADLLIDLLRVPAGAPLEAEHVVVQNAGMARWLALRTARQLGLSAGVRFPFPAAFVWELFERALGADPAAAAFEPGATTWRIMELLDRRWPGALDDYLAGGDDRRRYELSARIADLFEQYLVYRPDWIRRWEAGGDQRWQAELWRELVAKGARHRVHRLGAFFAALAAGRVARPRLPWRVALFGVPALPPAYLDVLARLGDVIDVHVFLMNPCRHAWSYIVSERDLARRAGGRDAAAAHLEVGHPLLGSLGKQGRELIDLVRDRVEGQVEDAFEAPPETTVLGRLQADVLELRRRGDVECPVVPWADGDHSIQVHACHGALREIEVLHDQLLALFDADPDLTPADVVVMTPDIEAYAPSIDAVFGTVPRARHINYTIADRSLGAESPMVRAFLELLALPASRYEASRLLALLDVGAVQRRFGFTEPDLTLARDWVRSAGIRWGVDAEARAALALPAIPEHTWRFGLDRLLLGHARRGDDRRLWAGILPVDDVEGGRARVAGLLATFAEAAFALRVELAAPRSPGAWAATLAGLVDRFFDPAETDERDAQSIRDVLATLADAAGAAGAEAPVSLAVAAAHLARELARPVATGRFLAGGVTFCALVPMRSIPFEIVCLVGMNDGSFPRPRRVLGFDLMADDFRPGDRSRRDDDRWLFLEALLSARRCLYVSYVGHDIRDNAERPPSPLVAELLDVLASGYDLPRERAVTHHALQPFSPRYFAGSERLFTYAAELAAASRAGERRGGRGRPLLTGRLPEAGDEWRRIDVEQLVAFYRNPARFFLRERLGIRLEESEGLVDSREPLVLDSLEAYQLRDELLALHRAGRTIEEATLVARAAGLVPHGRVGEAIAECEGAEAGAMAARLGELVHATPLPPIAVDLPLGRFHLTGTLDGVTLGGRVDYRPSNVKAGDWTTTWVRHLVLDAVAPPGVVRRSWFIGRDEVVAFGPVAGARDVLARLAERFWDGLHRPLPYVPQCALAALRKPGPPLRAARNAWESTEFKRGASTDPYMELAFRGTDPIGEELVELANEILGPALAAGEAAE